MAKSKTKAKARGRRRRRSRRMAGALSSMEGFLAYDAMIRDPCGAPFARAPYAGGTSGYMARINTTFVPTLTAATGTIGASANANVAYFIQPATFPKYLVCGSVGSTFTNVAQLGFSGTFLDNTVVKQYRCLAACLKWIPTGPIQTRQGYVSLGYTAASPVNSGDTVTAGTVAQFANNGLERQPNGSSDHEIRWIPNPADEQFLPNPTNPTNTNSSINIALVGVDAIYTGTTTVTLNGVLELTLIVEWLPQGSQGLSTAPEPNLPFTSQYYQSTIRDIGSFLLTGARNAANVVGSALARGAMVGVQQYVTSRTSARRYGASVPMIHDEL